LINLGKEDQMPNRRNGVGRAAIVYSGMSTGADDVAECRQQVNQNRLRRF